MKVHILDTAKKDGKYSVAMHYPVPAEALASGLTLQEALYRSGLSVTAMTKGPPGEDGYITDAEDALIDEAKVY